MVSLTCLQVLQAKIDLLTKAYNLGYHTYEKWSKKFAVSKISTSDNLIQVFHKYLSKYLSSCFDRLLWCNKAFLSNKEIIISFYKFCNSWGH